MRMTAGDARSYLTKKDFYFVQLASPQLVCPPRTANDVFDSSPATSLANTTTLVTMLEEATLPAPCLTVRLVVTNNKYAYVHSEQTERLNWQIRNFLANNDRAIITCFHRVR